MGWTTLKPNKNSLFQGIKKYQEFTELSELIKSLTKGIDCGLAGTQYELEGVIKLTIKVMILKNAAGKAGLYGALAIEGKYGTEDTSIVEIVIRRKRKRKKASRKKIPKDNKSFIPIEAI
jgi:hypothetical protein